MKNIDFENRIALGPMAGVTDLPFRLLCKEMGCDLMTTEMISAKGLMYNNHKTEILLLTDEVEHPIGVQLFGSDPEIMAGEAEKIAKERDFDFIDINMGCPVPKIVGNGEGSSLMKNPELAADIVRAMTSRIDIPVTVKIRSGFDENSINAPEMAAALEEAGAAAIAVHARTREQFYSGKADWSVIRRVKEAVKIPVIGNGDIESADPPRPTLDEIRDMMKRHIELMVKLKGEYIGVREMRKHIAWYTEGIKNSARLRRQVCAATHTEELLELVEGLGREQ